MFAPLARPLFRFLFLMVAAALPAPSAAVMITWVFPTPVFLDGPTVVGGGGLLVFAPPTLQNLNNGIRITNATFTYQIVGADIGKTLDLHWRIGNFFTAVVPP